MAYCVMGRVGFSPCAGQTRKPNSTGAAACALAGTPLTLLAALGLPWKLRMGLAMNTRVGLAIITISKQVLCQHPIHVSRWIPTGCAGAPHNLLIVNHLQQSHPYSIPSLLSRKIIKLNKINPLCIFETLIYSFYETNKPKKRSIRIHYIPPIWPISRKFWLNSHQWLIGKCRQRNPFANIQAGIGVHFNRKKFEK